MRILLEMESMTALGFHSVLAARPGSPIILEARSRGLTAYEIAWKSNLNPVAMWKVAQILRKHSIDIVNAHNSKDGWNAAPVARLMRRKIVRSRHIYNPIRQGRLSQLIYGPLSDRVMTTSESIKRDMIARGVRSDHIVSVPTGVDVARYAEPAARGRIRAEFSIPSDVPLVGAISVLRGDKGPKLFLEAAEAYLKAGGNAWFIQVGDGPMREKLSAWHRDSPCRDRIVLAGYRRDVPEILADLDLFVLPAVRPEGVPQAVLQAHAASIPVIASTLGGIDEVAIDGQTALGVPPRDLQALVHAMGKLLDDRDLARRLSSAGHDLVAREYSLVRMTEKMASLYRSVLAADHSTD